jgi:phenylalanyl-tRNA synthetase alpha subunit
LHESLFLMPTTASDLDALASAAKQDFAAAPSPAELENAKARFLGKSGRVTELLKGLATLSVDEKKARGADINLLKQKIEEALQARRAELAEADLQFQLKAEAGLGAAQVACIRSRAPSNASRPSLGPWVLKWPRARRSKPIG